MNCLLNSMFSLSIIMLIYPLIYNIMFPMKLATSLHYVKTQWNLPSLLAWYH